MIKEHLIKILNKYETYHPRTKLLIKNIVAGFFIKGGSVVCLFLMVPLTIDFVDAKQYGIWLTLSSVIGWASFFDIGLGHGLRNKFAEAIALNQHEKARRYVSSAYFMLGVIVLVLSFLYFIINPYINWATVLAAPQEMKKSLSIVASIVVYSFLIQLLLKLITNLLMASQLNALASLTSFIGNLLSLIFIFIATKITDGSLLILASLLSIVPTLVLFFYNVYFFRSLYRDFKPKLQLISINYVKSLFGLGYLFFIIQISALIQFQTANILIAHWFSPEDVAIYNVCNKYFSTLFMVFSLIVTPYWSAFTEAYSKNDFNWIRKIVNKTLKLWLIFVLIGLILLFLSPIGFKFWIGERLNIPFILSFFMLIYVLLLSFGSIFVTFFNGIGKIKIQTITSFISPVIFLLFSFFFVKVMTWGVTGIVLAIILSNFYGPIIAPIQYFKMISK